MSSLLGMLSWNRLVVMLLLRCCVSVLRMRLIKQFLAPASSWLDVVWFKVFPL